jgi:hypothetical protein
VSGRALERTAAGVSPSEASAQVRREFGGRAAGCNPAHRSPPLVMLAALADDDLFGCAVTEARSRTTTRWPATWWQRPPLPSPAPFPITRTI